MLTVEQYISQMKKRTNWTSSTLEIMPKTWLRMALGALIIKGRCGFTDRETAGYERAQRC